MFFVILCKMKRKNNFKRIVASIFFYIGAFSLLTMACATEPQIKVQHLGNEQSMIQISNPKKYILLPIEDSMGDSKITVIVDNQEVQTLFVRLAREKVDYVVPLDVSMYQDKGVALNISSIEDSALCWREIKMTDSFDITNRETDYRPLFHFSPNYGWMNDPNGMVYKEGEYHLFYQYNPYGSTWGNMHWGHAVTRDLINWEQLPVAIAPDVLGAIFSGSAVVDFNNSAGFGKDAIIAFYTSAGERQTQSIAYSLDNGRTFSKYSMNPVLTADIPDFRDPKVFWHEDTNRWIMIIASGQVMDIFSSKNLKEWTFESSFGEGQGVHDGVWECPDLIKLPIEGTNKSKWVLICNINPGGPFGGSATQYFVGDFDGKVFINDSPEEVKWMDYGRDHYATVTWSNAPDNRHIAIAWMSNWDYANVVPTNQFRNAMSVTRDLTLFEKEGAIYLKSTPSPELLALRSESRQLDSFDVDMDYNIDTLLDDNQGSFEIEVEFENNDAEIIGFRLFNELGEEINCFYSLIDNEFSMSRSKSGKIDFSDKFASVTTTPLVNKDSLSLRIIVDKASIELFGNEGEFAMTNTVFPNKPYNRINFYTKGGTYSVSSFIIYKLAK